ncbi:DNA-protecting protein DprA [Candidatus Daviesbacteria bacterium]|nr:DNA-protecting protein DprA [Candidatus Daviesbacteria bacterium]
MINNIPFLLALHSVDGLGPIRLKAILDYFKDPKLAWEANRNQLQEIGIPASAVNLLVEIRRKLDPFGYAQSIADSGIKWMSVFDQNYPKLLAQIYAPPVILYYQGEIQPEDKKAIAIVGTRKMTGYGKVVAQNFTKELSLAGLTIVSGLARGIDSQAHLTAIENSGRTIAVLGGGLNNLFPPENRGLAAKIALGFGAVISEFPPDCPSLPGNFPARNRIISGLSLGVCVVEAAEDSGSLITARHALEQGREVFAVPGPITSALSKGPITLIQEGARIVYSPEDILEELRIDRSGRIDKISQDLSDEEKKVLASLENENMHIDDLGRKLVFPAAKISALLLKMEISGLVQSLGSGIYCRR